MPIKKNITRKSVDEKALDIHNKTQEWFMPEQKPTEPAKKLNHRQELFCQTYVSKEFYGNWVQTYIEVYQPDTTKKNWYKTACATASEILTNPNICNRINELLESDGLNDQFVDKQMLFLLTQHADFGAKSRMIDSYNKLKGRITDKIEHSGKVSFDSFLNDVTNS